MTKKKRELIEILLDNVKPEDWPEHLPYAAQDKINGDVWAYSSLPEISGLIYGQYSSDGNDAKCILEQGIICRNWNKTIVHRDEFMKRWNERNPVDDLEGWIQWKGGEMPVEKGTLIDVKYRCGIVNLHVKAGVGSSTGSVSERTAVSFYHFGRKYDIIAYRLHAPQVQKTPQQLALEKFGTDWHDNEGVQPVNDKVLIDLIMCNGDEIKKYLANHWSWHNGQALKIKKWRIHSDQAALLREPMPPCSEEIPCHFVDVKEKKYLDKVDGEFVGIEKVIADRGSNYGCFEDGAEIMQQLKLIAHTSQGWERMKPIQREAMDMILHKIGRILNGDPAYVDSWVDIEGYSNLVSSWLKGESK